MAIKKSELYSSIWKSCDELRGGMDASQYKDYVLVLLFIKYISDKYAGVPYAQITVPKGSSFKDMVALKGKPAIGDDINKKIIGPIAEANQLSEMPDFNNPDKLGSGKDMVDRLSNLITIFENPALDFSKNRAEGDDILGDAYEYLMRLFATESGKSKGNFYTPAEVSRIMAKIIGVKANALPSTTVYDPTCGSGSLLLKVADETENGLTIYGQEMDVATAGLARMNMVIHRNATAEIAKGKSTLSNPEWLDDGKLRRFDFVVANPPFSYKSWTNGFAVQAGTVSDPYGRFTSFGVPPKKNGDYAFLLHIIGSLKSKGKGTIILPHGVLFRGNAEAEIRENIILRGYIKGIIGLPPNLFYGTGIPACIIVLDKENAENRKGIFMIDASKGFVKDGNKNRLREQDIHKIVDVFNKQTQIEKYSRMVSFAEIEKNEFNLNIPRYIDSQESDDIQDIEAHLLGDIPNADVEALKEYWDVCPSLKKTLFSQGKRPNYSKLAIEREKIKTAIYSHQEFIAFAEKAQSSFMNWRVKNNPKLKAIAVGDKPKKLIPVLAEDLLQAFSGLSLIDKYDVYQHLLTYWMETMQDDVYELVADGWEAGREIDKDPKKKNVWEGRLIPKKLLISRYFDAEQKAIEKLETDRDQITRQMEEMVEEHGGEDGLLSEVINDKGKVVKADLQKRIKDIKDDPDSADELKMLKEFLKLLEQETESNRKIKEAQAALEKKLLEKCKVLTIDEIKTLVVEDKWLTKLAQDVQSEIQRVSQLLTGRITELAERYENTLPLLNTQVADLEQKVNSHLSKMGFTWK
ncbi:type I restriction-modification system subunit M [Dehalococcoides sp. UCH007]|uniref:type I restriction-modification system subunit M n=1 Tax=Dehalococcoides sp. UCH007 TaxID=1522671 RepID=UPI0005B5738C|nr:type I restriction-modification system subunit M [Dehalococcoides sp. UCH007]OPX92545.1 MAG: Type I restriction enzyme EcoKI M protein [Pelotomaculum sp. PtaB.Bin104]BAQ34150.1 type I restriction-modification system modification subunit [Dehalococcoides sp. UCH007]